MARTDGEHWLQGRPFEREPEGTTVAAAPRHVVPILAARALGAALGAALAVTSIVVDGDPAGPTPLSVAITVAFAALMLGTAWVRRPRDDVETVPVGREPLPTRRRDVLVAFGRTALVLGLGGVALDGLGWSAPAAISLTCALALYEVVAFALARRWEARAGRRLVEGVDRARPEQRFASAR